MNDTVIAAIDDLRFRWPKDAELSLDIARFEVRQGERVLVHGPSGSGKSTLLGLFGGVLIPEHGTVRLLGKELTGMGAAARDRFRADHIGFIFQQFNLVPYLSVIDNVLLPCRFSKRRRQRAVASGSSPRREADRLLDRLDMPQSQRDRSVTRLSMGQQQRVAAARALIGRPEIVIADEPTSALDEGRQASFLDLLLGECVDERTALLFVSHDRRLAAAFTRVINLEEINRARRAPEST